MTEAQQSCRMGRTAHNAHPSAFIRSRVENTHPYISYSSDTTDADRMIPLDIRKEGTRVQVGSFGLSVENFRKRLAYPLKSGPRHPQKPASITHFAIRPCRLPRNPAFGQSRFGVAHAPQGLTKQQDCKDIRVPDSPSVAGQNIQHQGSKTANVFDRCAHLVDLLSQWTLHDER